MMKQMRKIVKKDRSLTNSQDGFSMVEVVMAIFLLTVGLMSAASVLVSLVGHQKLSAIFTSGTNLAQEKMESLRNEQYLNIASGSEDFGEISGYVTFKREVTATANADDSIKTIKVVVTHLGGQQVALETYIAR